ncbi:hypothetical protein JG687_00011587 [Phytophthora cactorum]|uniref:Uncharacterized protein n=1 Tax=Phytophthora cactorum TaxID=29920 RepID=A0A8T1U9C3_9STRA|nr:hypothetical protein JG687_00011587 [Phytophthora cactorum]
MTLSCLFGTTSVPIGQLKLSSMRHTRTSFFSVSSRVHTLLSTCRHIVEQAFKRPPAGEQNGTSASRMCENDKVHRE